MRATRRSATAWTAAAAVFLLGAPSPGSAAGPDHRAGGGTGPARAHAGFCASDPSPPEYYSIPLVATKRVPGTAAADGAADVLFGSTPFGVSLAVDGSFRYDLHIRVTDLPQPGEGAFVAWVTTPSLDRIQRLGALSPEGTLQGSVRWNKFLVVITLEPRSPPAAGDDGNAAPSDTWTGPIVLRGMSRSGMMHTMAGHGPFQQENCAAFGF